MRDRSSAILIFATGGLPAGRLGSWLASACIELRGDAEAKSAERFIAQHVRPQIAPASGEARLEPASPGP